MKIVSAPGSHIPFVISVQKARTMQDRLKLTSSIAVEVTMHGVSEELKTEGVSICPENRERM